jgi:opacity protein-like surface antigen
MSIYKTIFLISTLLLSPCLHAANTSSFKSGFYSGAMVGANIANASWRGTNTLTAINDFLLPQSIFQTWTPQGTTQQTNFDGRIFGGYQLVMNNLFSAVEIGGNFAKDSEFTEHNTQTFNDIKQISFTPVKTQSLTTTATNSTKVSLSGDSLYIDLKPGLLISPNFLIYGRAGLSFLSNMVMTNTANWSQDSGLRGTPTQDFRSINASAYSRNSATKIGMRLGVGTEYLLTNKLGIALDYTYTNYGNVTTASQGNQAGTELLNQFSTVFGTSSPNVSVRTQTILLGLNYHF